MDSCLILSNKAFNDVIARNDSFTNVDDVLFRKSQVELLESNGMRTVLILFAHSSMYVAPWYIVDLNETKQKHLKLVPRWQTTNADTLHYSVKNICTFLTKKGWLL